MAVRFIPCCLIAAASVAGADDFFTAQIEPLLMQHCYECHSHEKKMKGGLTLDSRSGWEEGGDNGSAVVPGKPEESLLIKMVRWTDEDHQMPPKKKLAAAEIALLEDWVKRGAADPRQVAVVQAGDDWWSLHPLPAKAERGSVDGFIAAKLRERGMAMAPEADRRTLIRRLTFDLHGLPPTPEEVEAFAQDRDEDADAKLVDRLLASPRYGERFARHWLDVVHYGESDGYGMDRPRMHAWPYRDYLIRAFNADKGYARFVQEQFAADALFPGEPATDPALWRDRQHWFEVRKRLEASEPMEKLADGDQQRLESRLAGLEERLRVMEETWTKVRADVTTTSPKTTVTSLPDGSVRFAGEALEKDTYTITIASGMPP